MSTNIKHNFAFASDNYSGVHPAIMDALVNANDGHDKAYGYDDHSQALAEHIRQAFGRQAVGYPVFNGTGANVLGLSAILPRFGAVICTNHAHINNDESIAPQYVAGIKLLVVDSDDGKLDPQKIHQFIRPSEHHPQARAVYITQTTELGTCYTLDELANIRQMCDKFGLYLYIDGARLSNAAAHLGCRLADIAQFADVLSLGGTKNGLMMGECLVFLNPKLDKDILHLRKSSMQLASKMRFISAQFVVWFEQELWLSLARHSNDMASYLYSQIKDLDGVIITQPVQSNAVFVILAPNVVARLHDDFHFYDWNDQTGEIRLMMSFDTTKEQVDELVKSIKMYLQG